MRRSYLDHPLNGCIWLVAAIGKRATDTGKAESSRLPFYDHKVIQILKTPTKFAAF